MTRLGARPDSTGNADGIGSQLVNPREGDVEDDAASPEQRSLLAIAGNLLVEISLPKLLFAWTVSLLLPAVVGHGMNGMKYEIPRRGPGVH